MKRAKTNIHHKKRHGHHQKRTKKFARVYLPYLPLTLIVIVGVIAGSLQPLRGTLAYATSMSHGGLLSSTNGHRSAAAKGSLSINDRLNQAAQAKANDMVARNYWSHNTPDGQEPWVFMDNAGYQYLKAGENLAYGFDTSDDTVTGWMNSPSHKANMLDGDFSEVGFGYANSSNFNQAGPQTIVVAMYGKPQTLAAAAPTPTPTPAAPTTTPANPPPAPSTPEPVAPTPVSPTESETKPKPDPETPVNSDNSIEIIANVAPKEVSRVQALTGGYAPWTLGTSALLTISAVIIMLLKHGLAFRRVIRSSERFIIHHPLLDATLIGLILVGLVLMQTVGVIL